MLSNFTHVPNKIQALRPQLHAAAGPRAVSFEFHSPQSACPFFFSRAKFDLSSGKVLVIGIDTSRPPRATAFEKFQLRKSGMEGFESADPMVVGVSHFC